MSIVYYSYSIIRVKDDGFYLFLFHFSFLFLFSIYFLIFRLKVRS